MGRIQYPTELMREAGGLDGAPVRIRPIRLDDAPRLQALHRRLNWKTLYQRFFSAKAQLPAHWARYLAEVDYRRRFVLVVERGLKPGRELIGVGRYASTGEPATAEVA